MKTATSFINEYDGAVPLQHYLKAKFSTEKKYGSKDRKHIAHLCYSYFRLGHFSEQFNAEDRIKIVLFLSQGEDWKDVFSEAWLAVWNKGIEERIAFIEEKYHQSITSIFLWVEELSEGIDKRSFALSHLRQPNLFIRIRPGKEAIVRSKLNTVGIIFKDINNSSLAFENATKLEAVIDLNKEYVVQDISSQQAGKLLSSVNHQPSTSLWDCCAASGGKAIMAYDLIPNIELTVSDVRSSIIQNLITRFQQANIIKYNSFIADLTQPLNLSNTQLYDLIICDAPCSGSGTWSRTPEQLYFFKEEEINRYSDLQKRIIANVILFIKEGGHLLYITCSVFKQENEDVVKFISEHLHLTLIKMELLKGYDKKGDTMFAALFTTSSSFVRSRGDRD